MQRLFPTGYQRGACKLAGISYKMAYPEFVMIPAGRASESAVLDEAAQERTDEVDEKEYKVDVRGFLVDANEWDEQFATFKAYEMGLHDGLTIWHWEIIYFLRNGFKKSGTVPTVYETCEAHHLELEDLERLFPNGYHRGAVKIAGLRAQ
jgi:tRNA 2-thiouridine synthesizing protein E